MANELTTGLADVLRYMARPLEKVFENATPLLDFLGGIETNPVYFTDGGSVKWPLKLNRQQGASFMNADGGTLPTPIAKNWDQCTVDTTTLAATVGFGGKARKAARGGPNSWVNIVTDSMTDCVESVKWTLDVASHLNGDSLLAPVTAALGAGYVLPVGVDANWSILQPGQVVDVLVRSGGATLALDVEILSVDQTLGRITTDTSMTATTAHGIYIRGSFTYPMQGLKQAAAVTGTFEGIDKAAVPQFQGIDKSPTTEDNLTEAKLDSLERAMPIDVKHKYLGDPAVLDDFKHSYFPQAQWAGAAKTLEAGWTAISFRGGDMVYDKHMEAGAVYRVPLDGGIKYVSRDAAPQWVDDDGAKFRHTARTLDVEAWYAWDIQMMFSRCNTIGRIGNLTRAE